MATDHATSIQGVALRVTKLAATGASLSGTTTSYVTSAFVRASFTPEYETGDEVSQKGADGSICIYYKIPDTLKRVNLALAVCGPEPEIYEILAGGTIVSQAAGTTKAVSNKALTNNIATLTTAVHGFTVGQIVTVLSVGAPFDGTFTVLSVPTTTTFTYAKTNADVTSGAATGTAQVSALNIGWGAPSFGVDPHPNGNAIEVWSKAIVGGKPAVVLPYFRWVFPFATMRFTGERVMENGALANTFEGEGLGNASFGTGPQLDWPYLSDRAVQYVRQTTAPVGVNDYQTVA